MIAADSLGPGTLIEHMETGVLTPVDDSAALADAIRGVVGDEALRAHLAGKGLAEYEARFTEAAGVQRYLDFLAKVAS